MREACIAVLIAFAAAPPAQVLSQKSQAEAEVLAAVADRDRALLAGDVTKVERSMEDEYLQTDVNGRVQDKAAWLKEYYKPIAPKIKSGEFRWGVFDRNDLQVRDFGSVAIVVGTLSLKAVGMRWSGKGWTSPGETARFTQVWVKRDGQWKIAAVHNALLPEKDMH